MKTLGFVTLLAVAAAGCDTETPSTVVADNDYPVAPDGGDPAAEMTVFKVWWTTTLLPDAVRPGEEGQSQRTVLNADFAYAVLAPGWDPASPNPPTRFIAVKSTQKLSVARGTLLHIRVSDETFAGNCAAGKPLTQEDADLVAKNIFPVEFAGVTYDAATCVAVSLAGAEPDATVDASDGGRNSEAADEVRDSAFDVGVADDATDRD